jgi:hypothetical protein
MWSTWLRREHRADENATKVASCSCVMALTFFFRSAWEMESGLLRPFRL